MWVFRPDYRQVQGFTWQVFWGVGSALSMPDWCPCSALQVSWGSCNQRLRNHPYPLPYPSHAFRHIFMPGLGTSFPQASLCRRWLDRTFLRASAKTTLSEGLEDISPLWLRIQYFCTPRPFPLPLPPDPQAWQLSSPQLAIDLVILCNYVVFVFESGRHYMILELNEWKHVSVFHITNLREVIQAVDRIRLQGILWKFNWGPCKLLQLGLRVPVWVQSGCLGLMSSCRPQHPDALWFPGIRAMEL